MNSNQNHNNGFMYIVVAKDIRPDAVKQNRITVHSKKEVIDKIILSLKTGFYVLKVEKSNLDTILDNWNFDGLDIEMILNEEAAKFMKKKYNKKYEPLLDLIIQVG